MTATTNQPTSDATGITLVASSSIPQGETLQASTSSSTKQSVANDTKSALYIGKKEPGNSVSVDVAVLEEGGFIVIYENTAEPTGEVLGVSTYLPAGEYTNVPITLSRQVQDGESFDAMLHKDNGDHVFNIATDEPLRGENGNSVHAQVVIQSIASEGAQ